MTTRLTFTPGNHTYWLADSAGKRQRIPSVSALKKTLHTFDNDTWKAGQIADAITDDWDTIAALPPTSRQAAMQSAGLRRLAVAREFGTAVHAYAAQLWTGEAVEVPDEYRGHVQSLADWWGNQGIRPVAAESLCWADDDGFGAGPMAGTLDLIIDHPAYGRGILDLKTWRPGSSGAPRGEEWCFQLAAYAAMETLVQDGEDTPFPRIHWVGVLHVGPGGVRLFKASSTDWGRARLQVEAARVLKTLTKPKMEEIA